MKIEHNLKLTEKEYEALKIAIPVLENIDEYYRENDDDISMYDIVSGFSNHKDNESIIEFGYNEELILTIVEE